MFSRKTSRMSFGINNSGPIAISELRKIDFCLDFVERMMLYNLDVADIEKC